MFFELCVGKEEREQSGHATTRGGGGRGKQIIESIYIKKFFKTFFGRGCRQKVER